MTDRSRFHGNSELEARLRAAALREAAQSQPAAVIASPLSLESTLCLMAAIQLAGVPVPDEPAAATAQVDRVVKRSLDILGHATYHRHAGTLAAVVGSAQATARQDAERARAAAEAAEAPAEPGAPSP